MTLMVVVVPGTKRYLGAEEGEIGTKSTWSRGSPGLGADLQTHVVEAVGERVRGDVEQAGEDAQVFAANRQHLAVEVLALDLDAGQEAFEDVELGIRQPVQPAEVDGDATGGCVGRGRGRSWSTGTP